MNESAQLRRALEVAEQANARCIALAIAVAILISERSDRAMFCVALRARAEDWLLDLQESARQHERPAAHAAIARQQLLDAVDDLAHWIDPLKKKSSPSSGS